MLNQEGYHSTAAIVAEVEDTSEWQPGENRGGSSLNRWDIEPRCVLQIANCDRSIAFEIEWQTEEERRHSLDKVDTMIESLTAFRRGLKIEQRRYAKRRKEVGDD
jgi:hypothetical protein